MQRLLMSNQMKSNVAKLFFDICNAETSLVVNVYFLVYFFVYLKSVAGFKFGLNLDLSWI